MTDETNEKLGTDVRTRVLRAASELIARGGIAALTTRSVAAAASVQAPTLYRLFGEKRGLLNAVAEHGLSTFVSDKAALPPDPDPVRDLANAWHGYVAFGLANPAVFAIMNEVGATIADSPAMLAGLAILRGRVERIARTGRLRMPVERAVSLIQAMCVGTVMALLAQPELQRDAQLSDEALAAMLGAILTKRSDEGAGGAAEPSEDQAPGAIAALAVGLRAHAGALEGLTPGENLLLSELLDRLSGR